MNPRLMACLAAAGCLLLIGCGEKFSSSSQGAGGAAGTSSNGGKGGAGTGATGGQGGATSNGGSGAGAGGAGGSCTGEEHYAPDVPNGWDGPFVAALAEGDGSPPCDSLLHQLHAELVSTDDTCECTCGVDLVQCEGVVLEHEFGICGGQTNFGYALPHTQCVPTMPPPATTGELEIFIHPIPFPGVCVSDNLESFDSDWEQSAHFCGVTPDRDGCTTIPEPYEPTLCIQLPGNDDEPCPAGYENGCTLYEGINDGRTCNGNACNCSEANVLCGGKIDEHTNGLCNTPSTAPACVDFNQAPVALRYMAELVGECAPVGQATIQGQLAATGPTRVCCTAPSEICPKP